MLRVLCVAIAVSVFHIAGSAEEPRPTAAVPDSGFPRVPPTEPRDALKTFRVRQGFHLDLLAAEPLVADPVDLAYDENGRAFVIEMRDYPLPEKPEEPPAPPLGRVRLLEDENGDGTFDRGTIFADQLSWPTAVALWKEGVFVAAAPDIWYFKDTDGDRRADVREKVFTGFSRDNVQAIVNNLKWGLDHRIYGAASGNGGEVVPANMPTAMPVIVKRRDFRFDPVTGEFDAISGGARFGHSFDDWGNRFLCNIRNPVQHVVLPSHYLERNRLLAVTTTMHDAAEFGDQLPVFRISPVEPWREFRARRWVKEGVNYPRSELVGSGFFTSSSGVTIYRGTAYPEEFRDNAFLADVAANIVHREALTPDGVTFRAQRADDRVEFVASTDIWFRPVNFVNAPDGTLHILDMYREVIEHPWSIPDDIRAKLDLTSGNDRGRIYRLAPPNFKTPPQPRLGSATTAELVRQLENPNSWWRETAHRLLYERQDQTAVEPLRELFHESRLPQGRLHALWSLVGLNALTEADIQRALEDSEPYLREHGVRLAEPRLMQSQKLSDRVLALADEESPRVRMQVAFTLGEVKDEAATAALARIAARDAGDTWIRTAILSSAGQTASELIRAILSGRDFADQRGGLTLLRELALLSGAKDEAMAKGVLALAERLPVAASERQYALISGLADGVQRRKKRLADLAAGSSSAFLDNLFHGATQVASDSQAALEPRLQAIQLVRHDRDPRVRETLAPLLSPRQPQEIQIAALRALGSFAEPQVATLLLDQWRQLTPPVRGEAVELLSGRPVWIGPFLDALESGVVLPGQVPPARRALLVNNRDAAIKARAERLFAANALSSRSEVVAKYQSALSRTGNPSAGAAIFKRECGTCHKIGNEGTDVGPPLVTIRNRSPEEVMLHILDPNREVAPNYLEYAVTLQDGRVLTGLITAETDTSLTLRRAQGAQDTVLRQDIDEIAGSGKSLMPEGFEQKITMPEMADLLAFLLKSE